MLVGEDTRYGIETENLGEMARKMEVGKRADRGEWSGRG